MYIVIALITSLLLVAFSEAINKYNKVFYALAAVLAGVSIFMGEAFPITQGSIPLALFVVVMFIGVLNKEKPYAKKLKSVRRELSVIASILLIPHAVMLSPVLYSVDISGSLLGKSIYITGIIAFLIMIPLFITSFKPAMKQAKSPKWKKLHKLSYIVYFLMYAHVMAVSLFNDTKYYILYSITFILYSALRLVKHYKNKTSI